MCGYRVLVLRHPGFVRIFRVVAPLKPAAIEDRNAGPAHEPGIEKGFAAAPACATVKSQMLFGGDAGFFPLGGNFLKLAGGVIHIPLVFHVVSI